MRIDTSSTTALNKLTDQSKELRKRFEPAWYMNSAFFLGDQWVFWNRDRLDRPIIPKHRLLTTENRIMPVVLTRLAKKTKQRPVWSVTPSSGDSADIDAAQLGEDLMEYAWRELCMESKLYAAIMWAEVCAAGFWKITWDPTAGKSADILLGSDGQPMVDQGGRMMKADQLGRIPEGLTTKRIAQGDVCLETRSPFEILPDPLGKSLDACEWLIEEVIQTEEYVFAHHGQRVKGDTEIGGGNFWNPAGASGSTSYRGVKIREMWMKPCSDFPKGRHTVWTKTKILVDEDNPYDGLPYVMFSGTPVPGRFWPTCIVEQLREPQTELNKIKSQIRENAQRIGNPALLKSRQANVEYSGVPGEVVLFDDTTQNATPSYLQPPGMPTYVIEEVTRIEEAFREISGQHEVTSSQVPAGVTAASAINLLLEQDDTRLGPTIYEMETALGYAGKMVLQLIGKYYNEERTIAIGGEDQNYDFLSFRGDALRGNTNVVVQAGSAFPASKAARQAAIAQTMTLLIQNGQPLDARVMRKVLRDYQVGGLESFFADVTNDIGQINRENRLLFSGQPLPITTADSDELHVQEHHEAMKSNKYFRAKQEVQALFVAHVQLHEQRIAEAQRGQQNAQMLAATQQQQIQTAGGVQEIQAQGSVDERLTAMEGQIKMAVAQMNAQRNNVNANTR